MLFQDDLGFDKKVFTQIGVRIDKNSSFGAGAPSFVLPKVGISYVLSEERFWKPLENIIPTFRLRGAWGSTGRSPPPGASLTTYSAAAYVVGSAVNPGVALNNPGNPTSRRNSDRSSRADSTRPSFTNGRASR